ncbi:MAG: hypothetical protein J6D34_02415 [Atopobiaceae bacterium]|nr:hypothetical protein [Atopobiaceae bacterium]
MVVTIVLLLGGLWLANRLELFIPSWVSWQKTSAAVDLDRDGREERIELANGRCCVEDASGAVLYKTPGDWHITRVATGDVDLDGANDLLMLTWRRGNYGTSRPFWDTSVDFRMTEHLYVFEMREGRLVPKWMSHELGAPVTDIAATDEGTVTLTTTDGARTTWRWEGFGFTLTR